MNRYCVSLYEIKFNLNRFLSMLHVLIYLIMSVTGIQRTNYLIYNFQFSICYNDKNLTELNSVTFGYV